MRKLDPQSVLLGLVLCGVTVSVIYVVFLRGNGSLENRADGSVSAAVRATAFDGERGYGYLKQVCAIGPRVSGSPGMQQQQELLTRHFTGLGGKVSMQTFDVRHPEDGSRVTMSNMIVEWHPDRSRRVLLCAHYDTRPYPDRDRRNPRGVFIGANDGGSGVAVLCEMAHHMASLDGDVGVDFVLFDGEEFVFDDERDQDYYFVGSTHFAKEYRGMPPAHRYDYGVLLDMVADAHLRLYREAYSDSRARPRTRELVRDIWRTAAQMGAREFVHRTRETELRDDHLPLNEIADIPTCDIIDFDYPHLGRASYWHTTEDTVDKCSAESLRTVGAVVLKWLESVEPRENR